MALSKRFALFTMVCTVCALIIAPAAGAANYPVPKPKGGTSTSKKPTKQIGKQLQNHTVEYISAHGVKVSVFLPKPGTLSCTVKHDGTKIGSGSVSTTRKKGETKKLKINFNAAGRAFLAHGAGQNVKVSCTFNPVKGKSHTSTIVVVLG